MSGLSPDPALTASLYCAGHLDTALFQAVAPFWRDLRQHDPARRCHLWSMRYGKGGEHLKIRVHGPEPLLSPQRGLLAETVARLLGSLPAVASSPRSWRQATSIDAEDEDPAGHPDRTLVWTTYRRSHVSLGGKPFLADDRYVDLITRCLASGCERVLALRPGAGGALPRAARQGALLKALAEGLAALELPAGKRAEYLAYHRDSLLRFILPRERSSEAGAVQQLQGHFDERLAGMAESLLPLRGMVAAEWNGEPDPEWGQSLSALSAYIAPLCRDPGYHLDPFASDPAFVPLFKVLHGLANQLGIRHVDEAFAHHALLRMAAS